MKIILFTFHLPADGSTPIMVELATQVPASRIVKHQKLTGLCMQVVEESLDYSLSELVELACNDLPREHPPIRSIEFLK